MVQCLSSGPARRSAYRGDPCGRREERGRKGDEGKHVMDNPQARAFLHGRRA